MDEWRLLCTKGPLAGSHWVLPADESLCIGRAPGNRIRLRLYREQLQLAYRKWHLDIGDRFKGIIFDRVEMATLERIIQTKRELADPSSVTSS